MKHFLIFNYDFPKYVRLDVGNETRMHLDKQGRYLLQPNRINGRVYYEQITGWNNLNTLTVASFQDNFVQKDSFCHFRPLDDRECRIRPPKVLQIFQSATLNGVLEKFTLKVDATFKIIIWLNRMEIHGQI